MDIISQGLLGSAVAQLGAKKSEIRIATMIGCIAGLLADADIFIQSSTDTLLFLEYHRHFTHSLIFIPIGAFISAVICWPFAKRHLSITRIYYYAFLGYLLSGVLDAFTSYGTHLLWPFADERIAWHLISVVDPIFTLALLAGVVTGLVKRANKAPAFSLIFCAAYLTISGVQSERAATVQDEIVKARGHKIEKSIVRPTLGNIVLWRSVYRYQGNYYIDAIRVGLGQKRIFAGTSVPSVDIDKDFAQLNQDSRLYQDIVRFKHFSNNYLALNPNNPAILGDVRYSITPTSAQPLWGILLNLEQPENHAVYTTLRQHSKRQRQDFIDQVLGTH